MSKQKKADFMLLLVTLFWGASYYMIDISLRDLQPMMLNAVRFLVAFALMGAVFFNKIKSVSKETLKYACIAGVAMSGAYLCCTLGVLHTSLSNAGFLGGLSVIFTPILGLIFKKQIPTGKFAVVAILCIVGVGLLTLNGGFKPAAGDLLCICGSLSFSCNLLITETAVKNKSVDPFQMAIYELGAVAVLMSIGALIFEKPSLPQTPVTWATTLFLAIFCSGVSITIQVLAQRHTTANHVGMIYTLEPMFVALIAYCFAGEVLSVKGYTGAAIMMSAILLMEVDIKVVPIVRKLSGRRDFRY